MKYTSVPLGYDHLCIEFCQKVKVFLEVSGQDGLDYKETEAFELHVFQVGQEVVLWSRHEEVPG